MKYPLRLLTLTDKKKGIIKNVLLSGTWVYSHGFLREVVYLVWAVSRAFIDSCLYVLDMKDISNKTKVF
jgi:hypothetical protein